MLLALGALAGCGGDPVELGRPLDQAAAIPLSSLLAREELPRDEVLVRGVIGEVCRSSGCWFVLQEVTGGKAVQLLTDLAPSASFSLPPGQQGRPVVVAGRLVGERPDVRLHAVALATVRAR